MMQHDKAMMKKCEAAKSSDLFDPIMPLRYKFVRKTFESISLEAFFSSSRHQLYFADHTLMY